MTWRSATMHSNSPPLYIAIVAQLFYSVVNACYIARHFMPILKELICTSTIILLVQGVPLLFQAFTYCIISKPSICDISQHSYISKERETTYSYYGTLQVSKYKVTILFSRSSCINARLFYMELQPSLQHCMHLHTWDNRVLL